jgi:hypothetical protein
MTLRIIASVCLIVAAIVNIFSDAPVINKVGLACCAAVMVVLTWYTWFHQNSRPASDR